MTIELQQSGSPVALHRQLWILKTNIRDHHFRAIATLLDGHADVYRWNVDLHDVDRVLRIESTQITLEKIIELLRPLGVDCEELPD